MKKRYIMPIILAAVITLSGCSAAANESSDQTSDLISTNAKNEAQNMNSSISPSAPDMFSNRDVEIGYDEETSAVITLSGNSAVCDSKAVTIDGSTVTINDEGTYVLSGNLDNGMIIVNAEDTDKIQLVLNGVNISNPTSAAIYVASADKVFITTVSDTENTLSNGGEYIQIDDNNIDAVIFSKDDLTLNGAGTLTVNAAAGHGIVSKDDLVLTGGTCEITAEKHGLYGKDSVRISNGTYTIKSGKDGIQSENTDEAEKGYIYISGGSFDITANGDGLSAEEYLTVDGGSFNIYTGDGSASVTMRSDAMGFGQRGEFGGFPTETASTETTDTVSTKGVKTDGALTITGGSFTTDTEDDAFHAGGNILISGGSFEIKTGDDGIHSDADVTIKNGEFNITYCYEGIEGLNITVDNGSFDITAHDDGFNAAGGTDSSGFGGGRPGMDRFNTPSDSSQSSSITFNSGTITVVSDGDCVDSNGSLTITGGKFDLTCNGNGNTALDCDGTYTCTGGDIITNDGSESNPGQMGGGFGGQGGHGGFGGQGNFGGHGNFGDQGNFGDRGNFGNKGGFGKQDIPAEPSESDAL